MENYFKFEDTTHLNIYLHPNFNLSKFNFQDSLLDLSFSKFSPL